ncbi:MAG: DUF4114 domain-containing protein [Bacteroidota bacterium]
MNLREFCKATTYLLVIAYLLVSCQDSIILPDELIDQTSFEVFSDGYVEINDVESDLQQRTQLIHEVLILDEEATNGRNNTTTEQAMWVQVAELATLETQGQVLSATHVIFVDDLALVSYHKRGDIHLGAIEVISLADPSNPTVTQQMIFNQADVNSIALDTELNGNRRKVWIALSDSKKGAVLGEVQLRKNGKFTDNEIKIVSLSKYLGGGISSSANAVVRANNFVYVTAGKSHGGTFCFDNNLTYIGHSSYSNAKYVAFNGSKVVSLQTGNNAQLRVENPGGFNFSTTYNVGQITHQSVDLALKGKNTLHFDPANPSTVYIATGKNGLVAMDVNNGERIYNSPSNMLTNGNTNGVTTDQEYLYMANGADGLTIYTLPVINQSNTSATFQWDLNETNASANFVQAYGEWVLVAKGTGGLKILKRPQKNELLPLGTFNARGRPNNLDPDRPVCPEVVGDIFTKALPENTNATLNKPELFNQPINKIILQEDAKVYTTFLFEGAGYRNTLGFYYYDKNNPPATKDDLTKIVIFPNSSARGSGGDLIPGNTMKVLGNFPKNTVIEFFLIADGFRNGKITEGRGTIYSNRDFNNNQTVQSLLLHDRSCEATVLCIEDIALPAGDKDYNDVIFQIRTSPKSAMNTDDFIHL